MILEIKKWPRSQEVMDDKEWFPIQDSNEMLGDSAYARIIDYEFNLDDIERELKNCLKKLEDTRKLVREL